MNILMPFGVFMFCLFFGMQFEQIIGLEICEQNFLFKS